MFIPAPTEANTTTSPLERWWPSIFPRTMRPRPAGSTGRSSVTEPHERPHQRFSLAGEQPDEWPGDEALVQFRTQHEKHNEYEGHAAARTTEPLHGASTGAWLGFTREYSHRREAGQSKDARPPSLINITEPRSWLALQERPLRTSGQRQCKNPSAVSLEEQRLAIGRFPVLRALPGAGQASPSRRRASGDVPDLGQHRTLFSWHDDV